MRVQRPWRQLRSSLRRVRECTSRGDECGLCRPSGRHGPKFGALEATPGQLRRVHESRLSWRLKAYGTLLRGGAVRLRMYWGQLRCSHAECESHACCGVGYVLRLSREVAWRIRCAEGNFRTTCNVCGNHACRGAWMDAVLSRGCSANPETLELAPEWPRTARINDCACRDLDACCCLFGGGRTAPKHWTHVLCGHAPCEISHRNVSMRTTPLSGGAVWELRRAPFRGPCLSREVRHLERADSRLRPTSLSGGAGQKSCRTPACGPGLSREAGHRGCAAMAPATPKAERRPPGCLPALQLRFMVETVFGPGSCTKSNRRPLRSCRPERAGRFDDMRSCRKAGRR